MNNIRLLVILGLGVVPTFGSTVGVYDFDYMSNILQVSFSGLRFSAVSEREFQSYMYQGASYQSNVGCLWDYTTNAQFSGPNIAAAPATVDIYLAATPSSPLNCKFVYAFSLFGYYGRTTTGPPDPTLELDFTLGDPVVLPGPTLVPEPGSFWIVVAGLWLAGAVRMARHARSIACTRAFGGPAVS